MPVIVPPDAFDLWLGAAHVDGADDATLAAALIAPAPDDLLEAYPVSTDVNRMANDNPKLIEPVRRRRGAGARADQSASQSREAGKRQKRRKNGGQGALF